MCLFLFLVVDDTATCPALLIKGEELHVGIMPANPSFDLQEQFFLMGPTEFSHECAVLNTLQTVIQTSISNFGTYAIMGNIVDEQTTHGSSPSCHRWLVSFSFTPHKYGPGTFLALNTVPEHLPPLFLALTT